MLENSTSDRENVASGTAFAFSSSAGTLFALHHNPNIDARAVGIVMCPPLGYDSLSAYRTYRHAAEQLCADGFHVLRFDYYGTGNSTGDATDLQDPVIDVVAAIEALKKRTGVTAVCLFGARAGALVALAAADQRSDIAGLMLLAVPPSGRAYVRELRAFASLSADSAHVDSDDVMVTGFLLSSKVLQRLSQLDIHQMKFTAALPVLMLSRDDIADDWRLSSHLTTSGCNVTRSVGIGYAAMMTEVEKSTVPHGVLQQLKNWCETTFVDVGSPSDWSASVHETLTTSTGVVETAYRFGLQQRIFGVVSHCQDSSPSSGRAVLLLNVGANHHIGSGRLYVTLARELATAGLIVLRFDVCGIGESAAMPSKVENALYDPDSVNDVVAAMDFLAERYQVAEFVLCGICFGAHLAFYGAVQDERVIAQLPINLAVFRESVTASVGGGFKTRRTYLRAIFQTNTWQRMFRGDINVKGIGLHLANHTIRTVLADLKRRINALLRRDVDTNAVERDMCTVLRRGVNTLLIYSEDDPALDTLALYCGADAVRLRQYSSFTMRQVPEADHAFIRKMAQQRLSDIVTDYIESLATHPAKVQK